MTNYFWLKILQLSLIHIYIKKARTEGGEFEWARLFGIGWFPNIITALEKQQV